MTRYNYKEERKKEQKREGERKNGCLLPAARKRGHVTCKSTPIRITLDYYVETFKTRRP